MSIETLQEDLKANIAHVQSQLGPLTSASELVAHLQNTLWPFLESLVEDMEQIDGCVDELYHQSEDILQPETGAVFQAMITGGLVIAQELKKRLAANTEDLKLRKAVGEFEALANQCTGILQEITIPEDDEEDAEDSDEDDEDADDEEGADE